MGSRQGAALSVLSSRVCMCFSKVSLFEAIIEKRMCSLNDDVQQRYKVTVFVYPLRSVLS